MQIYVAGGLTGTTAGDADAFTGTLAYDVGSNTWTDMGISPAGAHADACGGVTTTSDGKARFYVAGGFKLPDYETSSDVDYLDISTSEWMGPPRLLSFCCT